MLSRLPLCKFKLILYYNYLDLYIVTKREPEIAPLIIVISDLK